MSVMSSLRRGLSDDWKVITPERAARYLQARRERIRLRRRKRIDRMAKPKGVLPR